MSIETSKAFWLIWDDSSIIELGLLAPPPTLDMATGCLISANELRCSTTDKKLHFVR